MNPVFDYQCSDCGRRFPRKEQLSRHQRRTHPVSRVQCRWCPYTQPSSEMYRLRKHELTHQKYLRLIPATTPLPVSTISSTISTPWEERVLSHNTEELTQYLEKNMPDFADILQMEPRTPSPMRNLLQQEEVPSPPPMAKIPSDQLFKKYLTTSPVSSISLSESMDTPQDLADSDILPAVVPNMTEPTPVNTPLLNVPTCNPLTSSLPLDLSKSARNTPSVHQSSHSIFTEPDNNNEEPLDLTLRKKPAKIPLEPVTPIIDCTQPREWYQPHRLDPLPDTSKPYIHLCLDPRLFFAGAPSHYMTHPLSQQLQHIKASQQDTRSRYQRQLVPTGVKTIMKEERCYLPDGSMIELRDTWTAMDEPTEE